MGESAMRGVSTAQRSFGIVPCCERQSAIRRPCVGRGRRKCKIDPSALLSAMPCLLTATMSETGVIFLVTRIHSLSHVGVPRLVWIFFHEMGWGSGSPAKIIIKLLYLSILLRRTTLLKDRQWRKKSPSTASPASSIPFWKVLNINDDGRIKRSRTSVKVMQIRG
jgi:hypothetical protein